MLRRCSSFYKGATKKSTLFLESERDLECFVVRSIPHLTTGSLKAILSPVVAMIQIDLVFICY